MLCKAAHEYIDTLLQSCTNAPAYTIAPADIETTAGLEVARPHIAPHAVTPAAADPPPEQRLRPLIYVYDLPAEFNTRMLQVQAVEGAVRQCC